MTKRKTLPNPTRDTLTIEDTTGTPPRPILECRKCFIVLNTEQEVYQHQRSDSAGCIGALASMIVHLNDRLEIFEQAIERIAKAQPEASDPAP